MAIIFISIRKRQRAFFWGILFSLILMLAVISFVMIVPEFGDRSDVVVQEVFSAPDIKIDFEAIDSSQVKNLEVFSISEIENTINAGRLNPFLPLGITTK